MGFVLIGIGSYSALGTSGAMLQMVSHGLIGASLFFLVGATYDRTHTLQLDEMGVGKSMKIMFALWVMCSMASALPGMSGFVSELMVFLDSPLTLYILYHECPTWGVLLLLLVLFSLRSICCPCCVRSSTVNRTKNSMPMPIW